MRVVTWMRALVRDEAAQDLLEYALLITLIAMVVISALTTAETNISTIFTNIANKIPA